MALDDDRLLPGAAGRAALLVGACWGLVLGLAALTWHRRTTSVDLRVDGALEVVRRWDALDRSVRLGSPSLVLVVCVVLALLMVHRRQPRRAALSAFGPAAALLAAKAGQDLSDRPSAVVAGSFDAFPSGHMTSAAALTALLVLLTRRRSASTSARLLLGTASCGCAVVALALTAFRHHYVTDVVAGAAVATGVVVLTALLLDALPAPGRIRPRPDRSASLGGRRALPRSSEG